MSRLVEAHISSGTGVVKGDGDCGRWVYLDPWQKVALARAYMRDAQLLILDEPTAALDARGEYEVFLRFSELTKGRMAVLISHRFSTVRMADRILVLKGGNWWNRGRTRRW